MVELLLRHRARQAAERMAVGEAWEDHGLVFSSEVGTPLDPDNVCTCSPGSAGGLGSDTGICTNYGTLVRR
jgi:hypothetical protein